MRFVFTTMACLAVLSLFAARPGAAQSPGPWSRLEWSGGAVENVNRVGMHTWWRPWTGGYGRAAVPWHHGFLEVGLRVVPLTARSSAVPDWLATTAWAGWGIGWQPVGPARLSLAARAGVLRMDFDEDTAFAGVRSESELTIGTAVRLELFPARRLGMFFDLAAERTLTSTPVDWLHASAGLVVHTGLPRWLRRVLE